VIDTDDDYLRWFCTKRFDEHDRIIRDGFEMGYQQDWGLRIAETRTARFPTATGCLLRQIRNPQSLFSHLFHPDAFFAQLVS